MRLLLLGTWSDGGFGKVTRELGTRWVASGVDVRVLAVDHRGEPIQGPLAGRVWPASLLGGSHGSKTGTAITGEFWAIFGDDWKPDTVFAIEDMSGVLARMGGNPGPEWADIYHYIPIEGDNLPPLWGPFLDFVKPVAMSKYGQTILRDFLERDIPMVYHGVDTETFRPVTPNAPITLAGKRLGTKAACKEAFGLDPNRQLILRSDAPVPRKFYDRFAEAMVPVLEASPDTDVLLHCSPQGNEGIDIIQELKRQPGALWGRTKFTGVHDTFRGLTEDGMAALMNAADLYVSTTGGEGFGLNLAEALACEVPVVVTDWAATREVVGPGGHLVSPLIDSYGEPVRYHSRYGMDWAVPDPKAFTEPILSLLAKPARRRALGAEGREHVVKNFSWDVAAASFLSMFEEADASVAA